MVCCNIHDIIPFEFLQDSERRSPLHAAAFCGEVDIVTILILNGARVNIKDNRWLTPLHRACCSGSEVGLFCGRELFLPLPRFATCLFLSL